MTRYETVSVDRRAEYYARAAKHIAADPLNFYTRAEQGRKWQAAMNAPKLVEIPQANVISMLAKRAKR